VVAFSSSTPPREVFAHQAPSDRVVTRPRPTSPISTASGPGARPATGSTPAQPTCPSPNGSCECTTTSVPTAATTGTLVTHHQPGAFTGARPHRLRPPRALLQPRVDEAAAAYSAAGVPLYAATLVTSSGSVSVSSCRQMVNVEIHLRWWSAGRSPLRRAAPPLPHRRCAQRTDVLHHISHGSTRSSCRRRDGEAPDGPECVYFLRGPRGTPEIEACTTTDGSARWSRPGRGSPLSRHGSTTCGTPSCEYLAILVHDQPTERCTGTLFCNCRRRVKTDPWRRADSSGRRNGDVDHDARAWWKTSSCSVRRTRP
jgi:hypothetical protein